VTLDTTFRAAGRKVAEASPTSRLLNFSAAKSGEQSENVYENKGRGNEVEELRSRGVEESRSREAEPGSQAVGCRLLVTLRLLTLDFST
jgi:hypothetical protein